jgi:hypothetical protein
MGRPRRFAASMSSTSRSASDDEAADEPWLHQRSLSPFSQLAGSKRMAAGCILNRTLESEMAISVYLKRSAFGTTIGSGWRRTL